MKSANKIGRSLEKETRKALDETIASGPKVDFSGAADELSKATAPKEAATFKEAFAEARKKAEAGGSKVFTWKGKSYGTQLASEVRRAPVRASTTPRVAAQRQTPSAQRQTPPARQTPSAQRQKPPTPRGNIPTNLSAALLKKPDSLLTMSAKDRAAADKRYKEAVEQTKNRRTFFGLFSEDANKALREKNIRRGFGSGKMADSPRAQREKANAEARKKAEAAKRPKDVGTVFKKPSQADIENAWKKAPTKKKGGKITAKATKAGKAMVRKSADTMGRAMVKKYAKGGSVDGCAVRGKTRAPMKKGK